MNKQVLSIVIFITCSMYSMEQGWPLEKRGQKNPYTLLNNNSFPNAFTGKSGLNKTYFPLSMYKRPQVVYQSSLEIQSQDFPHSVSETLPNDSSFENVKKACIKGLGVSGILWGSSYFLSPAQIALTGMLGYATVTHAFKAQKYKQQYTHVTSMLSDVELEPSQLHVLKDIDWSKTDIYHGSDDDEYTLSIRRVLAKQLIKGASITGAGLGLYYAWPSVKSFVQEYGIWTSLKRVMNSRITPWAIAGLSTVAAFSSSISEEESKIKVNKLERELEKRSFKYQGEIDILSRQLKATEEFLAARRRNEELNDTILEARLKRLTQEYEDLKKAYQQLKVTTENQKKHITDQNNHINGLKRDTDTVDDLRKILDEQAKELETYKNMPKEAETLHIIIENQKKRYHELLAQVRKAEDLQYKAVEEKKDLERQLDFQAWSHQKTTKGLESEIHKINLDHEAKVQQLKEQFEQQIKQEAAQLEFIIKGLEVQKNDMLQEIKSQATFIEALKQPQSNGYIFSKTKDQSNGPIELQEFTYVNYSIAKQEVSRENPLPTDLFKDI